MYRCCECGRAVEKLAENRPRCPYCGSKILYKPRREIIRKIKAR
ncbi:MAG: DNA-directed RNA polymerase subunit P [Candidatus Hadarchaeaceae archaeon]